MPTYCLQRCHVEQACSCRLSLGLHARRLQASLGGPAECLLASGPAPCPAGTPLQNFTSYSNVLFGDEQGGDVLAGEPAAAKPQAEAETPRSMSVADKVQQQIALNQQKRLARLQVRPRSGFGLCTLESVLQVTSTVPLRAP